MSEQRDSVGGVCLIGISGKIGSGKTTLAEALQRRFDGVVVCNFADALKREVAAIYDVPLARFYDRAEKDCAISGDVLLTIGEALQHIGALRRAESEDYWLKRTAEFVAAQTCKFVVIGDVRFTNEADWVRERGGFLVRLEGDPGKVRARSTRSHAHSSETQLDAYDHFDALINTDRLEPAVIVDVITHLLALRQTATPQTSP